MWGGAFPEPLTFSLRALRALRARPGDFDIVHDNQGLGYGMLGLRRLGLPLVTSIHHPITVDRRLDLAGRSWLERLSKRRWYGFVRMQGRVARRAGPLITVSGVLQGRHMPRFPCEPGKGAYRPAGRGHPALPPAPGATARAGPDRDRDQRRLTAQGAADAAARGRQAGHGARRAPRGRRHAVGRHQAAGDAAGPRRPGHVRQRPARRGVRAAARLGRGGGDPVDVRGVLAARGGAHGVGHAADRQPGRRAARGHRGRRAARDARRSRRNSPPRCAACSTTPDARARGSRRAAWPGCASGSPGPRSPPRPRRCTGR